MIITRVFSRMFNDFIFENFFIGLCAVSMCLATFLMNGLPLSLTPFVWFLFFSTFLLYNFHRIAFHFKFPEMRSSLKAISLNRGQKINYSMAVVGMLVSAFFMNPRIYPYLIPLIFLSLTYSIPSFRVRGKILRLREIYLIKTPVLALVWGLTTRIIPLVEQNISFTTTFVLLQSISSVLFIFALCIPFEVRDMQTDSLRNVKTLPVILGEHKTKLLGVFVIIVEIILHHYMSPWLTKSAIVALDLSSILALIWIAGRKIIAGKFYYKFFVDGTMVVRFLMLLFAARGI